MKIPTLNSFMGRILDAVQNFYLPASRIRAVRGFPAPARFVLNPLWKGELYFMLYGCPKAYREEFALLKSEGPFNGDILDVGANMGSYSIYFYHELRKDPYVVHSFEPVQVLARKIQDNAIANDCGDRLRVESVAVGDFEGVGTIYVNSNLYEDCGQSSLHERSDYFPLTVPIVTLDKYCGDRKIALIKIDAEGNEEKVLRGAMGIVRRDHPKIFFEINKGTYGTFSKGYDVFKELLSPLGYKLFFVDHGRLIPGEDAIREGHVDGENLFAK